MRMIYLKLLKFNVSNSQHHGQLFILTPSRWNSVKLQKKNKKCLTLLDLLAQKSSSNLHINKALSVFCI